MHMALIERNIFHERTNRCHTFFERPGFTKFGPALIKLKTKIFYDPIAAVPNNKSLIVAPSPPAGGIMTRIARYRARQTRKEAEDLQSVWRHVPEPRAPAGPAAIPYVFISANTCISYSSYPYTTSLFFDLTPCKSSTSRVSSQEPLGGTGVLSIKLCPVARPWSALVGHVPMAPPERLGGQTRPLSHTLWRGPRGA